MRENEKTNTRKSMTGWDDLTTGGQEEEKKN